MNSGSIAEQQIQNGFSKIKSAAQLALLLVAFSGASAANSATISGDLTVAASTAQVLPDFVASATAIDFGDATIAADGVLDSDGSAGADVSLISGSGDFPAFLFGSQSASANFYDFDLSGAINSASLLFTWDDYIVHDTSAVVNTAATFGSGSLTALDFTGTGILSSASDSFDDTVVTWVFGSTGISTGQLTIFADGVAVVPVPGALILFGSALGGLIAGRKARRH